MKPNRTKKSDECYREEIENFICKINAILNGADDDEDVIFVPANLHVSPASVLVDYIDLISDEENVIESEDEGFCILDDEQFDQIKSLRDKVEEKCSEKIDLVELINSKKAVKRLSDTASLDLEQNDSSPKSTNTSDIKTHLSQSSSTEGEVSEDIEKCIEMIEIQSTAEVNTEDDLAKSDAELVNLNDDNDDNDIGVDHCYHRTIAESTINDQPEINSPKIVSIPLFKLSKMYEIVPNSKSVESIDQVNDKKNENSKTVCSDDNTLKETLEKNDKDKTENTTENFINDVQQLTVRLEKLDQNKLKECMNITINGFSEETDTGTDSEQLNTIDDEQTEQEVLTDDHPQVNAEMNVKENSINSIENIISDQPIAVECNVVTEENVISEMENIISETENIIENDKEISANVVSTSPTGTSQILSPGKSMQFDIEKTNSVINQVDNSASAEVNESTNQNVTLHMPFLGDEYEYINRTENNDQIINSELSNMSLTPITTTTHQVIPQSTLIVDNNEQVDGSGYQLYLNNLSNDSNQILSLNDTITFQAVNTNPNNQISNLGDIQSVSENSLIYLKNPNIMIQVLEPNNNNNINNNNSMENQYLEMSQEIQQAIDDIEMFQPLNNWEQTEQILTASDNEIIEDDFRENPSNELCWQTIINEIGLEEDETIVMPKFVDQSHQLHDINVDDIIETECAVDSIARTPNQVSVVLSNCDDLVKEIERKKLLKKPNKKSKLTKTPKNTKPNTKSAKNDSDAEFEGKLKRRYSRFENDPDFQTVPKIKKTAKTKNLASVKTNGKGNTKNDLLDVMPKKGQNEKQSKKNSPIVLKFAPIARKDLTKCKDYPQMSPERTIESNAIEMIDEDVPTNLSTVTNHRKSILTDLSISQQSKGLSDPFMEIKRIGFNVNTLSALDLSKKNDEALDLRLNIQRSMTPMLTHGRLVQYSDGEIIDLVTPTPANMDNTSNTDTGYCGLSSQSWSLNRSDGRSIRQETNSSFDSFRELHQNDDFSIRNSVSMVRRPLIPESVPTPISQQVQVLNQKTPSRPIYTHSLVPKSAPVPVPASKCTPLPPILSMPVLESVSMAPQVPVSVNVSTLRPMSKPMSVSISNRMKLPVAASTIQRNDIERDVVSSKDEYFTDLNYRVMASKNHPSDQPLEINDTVNETSSTNTSNVQIPRFELFRTPQRKPCIVPQNETLFGRNYDLLSASHMTPNPSLQQIQNSSTTRVVTSNRSFSAKNPGNNTPSDSDRADAISIFAPSIGSEFTNYHQTPVSKFRQIGQSVCRTVEPEIRPTDETVSELQPNQLKFVVQASNGIQPRFKIPKLDRTVTATQGNILSNLNIGNRTGRTGVSEINNQKSSEISTKNDWQHILHLFQRPCFQFLRQLCTKKTCKFSHELPSPDSIRTKLLSWPNVMILRAYNQVVLKNNKMFFMYFAVFCDVFGFKNERFKLISMITDCEADHRLAWEYLPHVVNGLIRCNIPKTEALQLLIINVKRLCPQSIDVLVDLIAKTDIKPFAPFLDNIAIYHNYTFNINVVNQVLHYVVTKTDHHLVIMTLHILDKCPKKQVNLLDQMNLAKFYDMLQQSVCAK